LGLIRFITYVALFNWAAVQEDNKDMHCHDCTKQINFNWMVV
jgi:hypothetical protein